MKRKMILCGMMLVVLLLGVALLGGNCLKSPMAAWYGTNVDLEDVLTWRTDPQKLVNDALWEAKSLVFSNTSLSELIQPVEKMANGQTFGVDWSQQSYRPVYITFYYEWIETEQGRVSIVRGFRASPSFMFWLGKAKMPAPDSIKLEVANRQFLIDPKMVAKAKANEQEIVRLLDTFSDPNSLPPSPELDPSNWAYNPMEIQQLKSWVGPISILLQANIAWLETDAPTYLLHTSTGRKLSPQARQELIDEFRKEVANLNSRWPAAYIDQYFAANQGWLKFRAVLSLWGTALFCLLIGVGVYLVSQLAKPRLCEVVIKALEKEQVATTLQNIKDLQTRFYSTYPKYWLFQPRQGKILALLHDWVLEYKDVQQSERLKTEATDYWNDMGRAGLPPEVLTTYAGIYAVCLDEAKSLPRRRECLGQLHAGWQKFVVGVSRPRQLVPQEPRTLPSREKRTPPPKTRWQAAMDHLPESVAQLRGNWFWRELSPREIETLAAHAEWIESLRPGAVEDLLSCANLRHMLISTSEFVKALKNQHAETVLKMIPKPVTPEAPPEPAVAEA